MRAERASPGEDGNVQYEPEVVRAIISVQRSAPIRSLLVQDPLKGKLWILQCRDRLGLVDGKLFVSQIALVDLAAFSDPALDGLLPSRTLPGVRLECG